MFNVGSIVGELVLKDQFTGELKSAEQASVKASAQLTKSLAAVSAAAVAMGAAMLDAAKATANYRDETTKAARSAGMSVEEFSQLRHAAELSGIQFNELAISMSKLASPEAGKRLQRLGIEMTNLDGTAKSNAEIFDEVADKVAQAGSASEKTRIAVAAFGEEGSKMVSMLDNGSEGLAKLKQEAIDLGIAFDAEAGKQAELFNDNLDRLNKSVQGVRDSFGQAVIEFINSTGIVEALTDAIAGVSRWFNNLDQSTKDIIVAIGAIIVGIGLLIAGFMVVQAIGPAVGAAMTAAFGPVGLIILAIVGAIGALVAVIVVAVKNWERFGRAVEPIERVFQSLKKVFSDIWSRIQEALPVVKNLFSGNEGKGFIDYLIDGIMIVIKALGTVVLVVEELISVLPKIFERIGHLMTGVWQQLKFEAKLFRTAEEEEMLEYIKMLNESTIEQMGDIISESGSNIAREVDRLWSIKIKEKPPTTAGEESADSYIEGATNTLENTDVASKFRNFWDRLSKEGIGSVATQGGFSLLPDGWQQSLAKQFQGAEDTAEMSADQISEAFKSAGSTIMDSLGALADGYSNMLSSIAEATQAKMQRASEIMNTISEIAMEQVRKRNEEELAALDAKHEAEIQMITEQSLQRMLLEDEALAAKKARLEEELNAELEKERILFEQKKQFLMEESADREQARLAQAVMEEDWAAYVEMRNQQLNERLLEEERQSGDTKAQIENQTQTKITEVQETQQAEREEIQKRQEKETKDHNKRMALIQYAMDLYAYQAQKDAAIAGAGMKLADSIMSSVQAGAALAAVFPPFTVPLGVALTAALAAMSVTAYNSSIAAINAQKPLPPPSLFMAQGGTVVGRTHAQGGVPAELEHGEMVVSRADTQRLRGMIERDESSAVRGGVIISSGAIVIYNYGTMDDAAVDKISMQVAERIEQRRF